MSSYGNQKVLMKQNQRCGQQEKTSIRILDESHPYWNKHFHKNPLNFRIYANFVADNEIDHFSIDDKTTNKYNKTQ